MLALSVVGLAIKTSFRSAGFDCRLLALQVYSVSFRDGSSTGVRAFGILKKVEARLAESTPLNDIKRTVKAVRD